jgi:two-component system, chemotaxis family, chemotaxis protein CheY
VDAVDAVDAVDGTAGGAGGAGGPVVLVVEDDAATRALLREVLEGAGYAVREAADGAAGLRLARAARPALVLLDLRLPYLDGRALARAYRAGPGPRAPVLVVTAEVGAAAGAAAVAVAAEVGAAAALGKPFDLDELLALVRRLTAGPPRRPPQGAGA